MATVVHAPGSYASHVIDMEPHAVELMVEAGEAVLQRLWRSNQQTLSLAPGARGGHYAPMRRRLVDLSSRPEDETATLTLSPSPGDSFGFMFSTNTADLLEGVNHYVSSVDEGGAAAIAGLQ